MTILSTCVVITTTTTNIIDNTKATSVVYSCNYYMHIYYIYIRIQYMYRCCCVQR